MALRNSFLVGNDAQSGAIVLDIGDASGDTTIVGYTANCRDFYKNIQIGISNLLINQDASGRALGTTPITTGNGKHIIFPMLPTPYDYTAPMCFKEAHGDTASLTITHCDDTTEVI